MPGVQIRSTLPQMDLQTSQQKVNYYKIIPLVLMGVGLIVLGIVAGSVLMGGNSPTDSSVVPSVVDFPAPGLTLSALNGTQCNIADYRQQIMLINNWATWCPTCK